MAWMKLFTNLWLEDCNFELQDEVTQASYIRLLCYANNIGENGAFVAEGKVPLTEEIICRGSKVNPAKFNELVKMGKIVKTKDLYTVSAWQKYQNEYSRQKGYREKLHKKVTSRGYE